MDGSMEAQVTTPPSLPPSMLEAAKHQAAEREALEQELTTLWGHINAATYRFLKLLAEFDRKEYWGGVGILSCAHWLNVFCGIGTVAAREKVRVARALEKLPQISESFRKGEISYSKVRAMTRVATPEIEADLLMIAHHGTASHMARLVRYFRRVEHQIAAEESREAEQRQAERYVRTHYDDDGMLVLNARLPAEVGAVVLRAMDAAMELEYQARKRASAAASPRNAVDRAEPDIDTAEPEGVRDSSAHGASAEARVAEPPASRPPESQEEPLDLFGARRADAIKRMAEHFLDSEKKRCASSGERYQVVVHIDQAFLSGTDEGPMQLCELEDGPRLALETARRLSCDAELIGLVEDEHGEPLNVGRKTRAISTPLKRAIRARDRGCRFPGCEHRRYTEGHHIRHWANGGESKPDNLVTLCSHHHRLLHEGGFSVVRNEDGQFRFFRPDGRPLEARSGPLPRFRGSAGVYGHAQATATADPGTTDRDDDDRTAELIAIHSHLGLDIDSTTALTRWTGERMDYSLAIEWMYSRKHGTSMA